MTDKRRSQVLVLLASDFEDGVDLIGQESHYEFVFLEQE
jgi:hypothetical protein